MTEFEKEIIARLESIEGRVTALELPNVRLGPVSSAAPTVVGASLGAISDV